MIRKHLDRLNDELKQKEEQLQEERMERNKAEVELGREKDCNRVQLSETRRELQELKASLRVAQKDKEQLQAEKKEVIEYIHQLEQRLENLSGSKWSVTSLLQSQADSSLSESEDENPEALRPISHYSLCEQPQSDLLLILPTTPPPSPHLPHSSQDVVISQPAPLCSPHQPGDDTHKHAYSSESEEEYEVYKSGGNNYSDEMALLLPDHRNAVLSDMDESPLW